MFLFLFLFLFLPTARLTFAVEAEGMPAVKDGLNSFLRKSGVGATQGMGE